MPTPLLSATYGEAREAHFVRIDPASEAWQ
jgi:hypothetical protein